MLTEQFLLTEAKSIDVTDERTYGSHTRDNQNATD